MTSSALRLAPCPSLRFTSCLFSLLNATPFLKTQSYFNYSFHFLSRKTQNKWEKSKIIYLIFMYILFCANIQDFPENSSSFEPWDTFFYYGFYIKILYFLRGTANQIKKKIITFCNISDITIHQSSGTCQMFAWIYLHFWTTSQNIFSLYPFWNISDATTHQSS